MMKKTLVIVLGLLFFFLLGKTSLAHAAATLEPSWETNSNVRAIIKTPDKIYIGGDFTYVGPKNGSLGTYDINTQSPVAGMPLVDNGYVNATVPDGSGGWYIGGSFTSVGGISRPNLAHIRPDMTVDPTWNPSPDNTVLALAVDGSTLYVGGKFASVSGQVRNRIAALNTIDGSATAWNPDANDEVHTLAISGSTVYVGGFFTTFKQGTVIRNRIAAITTSSDTPTAWNPDANNSVETIAVSGSTVYVGGFFTTFKQGTVIRNRIAAITTSSDTPTAWNPNADNGVWALTVSGDGTTVYAGGYFLNIAGGGHRLLVALDAVTGAATSFDPGYVDQAVSELILVGSKLYIGGGFSTVGGQPRVSFAELDAQTGAVTNWSLVAGYGVYAFGVDGTKLSIGTYRSIGGQMRNRLAALDATTGEPTMWNPGANGIVLTLALNNDGSILYAGGTFTTIGVGASPRGRVAALNTSDGVATDWNPYASGGTPNVRSLILSSDGSKVYVAGYFDNIGGQPRSNIAAINSAGLGTVTDWNPGADGEVFSMAMSGSTVYVGGYFNHIGSQTPKPTRNRIAAINTSDLGTATAWNPAPVGVTVNALAVSGDGTTVYVGGYFTQIGSQTPKPTRNNLAALNSSDGSATSWNPGANGEVQSLAFNRTAIYVGGVFTNIGGASRVALAELKVDDGSATSWDASLVAVGNPYVSAVAVSGTTVYAGGYFATILGQHSWGFGVISGATVLPVPLLDRDAWETNGTVNAIATTSSTIYIGGQFDYVGPKTGGLGLVNTSTSNLVANWPAVNGSVYTTVTDGSNGWYIGGSFTSVGGIPRNNIAHILSDFSVDLNWNPDANNTVYTLARSTTGTLFAGGSFTRIGGQDTNYIGELYSSGAATPWNPNADGVVYSIAVDGTTIYAGGNFNSIGRGVRHYIAALNNSNGDVISAWNPSPNNIVRTIVVSSTLVYAGGDFTQISTDIPQTFNRNYLAAMDKNVGDPTSWDPNAGGGSPTRVNVLAISVDGTKVYVGGDFGTIGGSAPGGRANIAQLEVSTGLITTWNPNAANVVYSLLVSGSTVYAGGEFNFIGGLSRRYLAAIDSNGAATSWNPKVGMPSVYALAINGTTIAAGGTFSSIGGVTRNNIAALDISTGAATSWNPGGVGTDGTVHAFALNSTRTLLYVGGAFLNVAGQSRTRIAALNVSDGAATLWNPAANQFVYALGVSPDDATVYAGGGFTFIGTKARNRIAALSASTGKALNAWNPNADNIVRTLAVSGSVVYVGGDFLNVGGAARQRIASLGSNGSAIGWDPKANGIVRTIVLGGGGTTVYAGGDFTLIGSQLPQPTHNKIAKLDASSAVADAWAPDIFPGPVNALALNGDGSKIYAGGNFWNISGATRNFIAEVDTNVGVATTWDGNANNTVNALAVNGTTVLAGGTFTSMLGGQLTRGFAILQ